MSHAETKEASLLGPVAQLTTVTNYEGALRGVVTYDATTTNGTAALPTKTMTDGSGTIIPLQNMYLRVYNRSATATLDFAFGVGTAPTLVAGQLANFATGHVSAGWPIGPGSFQDFIVPNNATHVAWILESGASASKVSFYCSEGNVGSK